MLFLHTQFDLSLSSSIMFSAEDSQMLNYGKHSIILFNFIKNYLRVQYPIEGWLGLEDWDGQAMQPEWRKVGLHSKFCQVHLQERDL